MYRSLVISERNILLLLRWDQISAFSTCSVVCWWFWNIFCCLPDPIARYDAELLRSTLFSLPPLGPAPLDDRDLLTTINSISTGIRMTLNRLFCVDISGRETPSAALELVSTFWSRSGSHIKIELQGEWRGDLLNLQSYEFISAPISLSMPLISLFGHVITNSFCSLIVALALLYIFPPLFVRKFVF